MRRVSELTQSACYARYALDFSNRKKIAFATRRHGNFSPTATSTNEMRTREGTTRYPDHDECATAGASACKSNAFYIQLARAERLYCFPPTVSGFSGKLVVGKCRLSLAAPGAGWIVEHVPPPSD